MTIGVLVASAIGFVLARAADLGFSRSVTPGLISELERRFGDGARARIERWKAFVRDETARSGPAAGNPQAGPALRSVNAFFNEVPAATDLSLWGAEEYWATPAEMLAVNGADCEDFAFAKYFSLKELGMPVGRLRLVYVRTPQSAVAHMVLAYYPEPRADPLILDNLDGRIVAASARPELTPVFSFNDDDLLYYQDGASTVRLDPSVYRKWGDYLRKLERELAR